MDYEVQVVGELTHTQMLQLAHFAQQTRCKIHIFRNQQEIENHLDASVPVLLMDPELFPYINSGPIMRNGLMPVLPDSPLKQKDFNGFVLHGRDHTYIHQTSPHFAHLNNPQLRPVYQYAVHHSRAWKENDLGLAIIRNNYPAIELYFDYFEQNEYSLLAPHNRLLFTHLSELLEDKSSEYQVMLDTLSTAMTTPNRERDRNMLDGITSSLSLLRYAMGSYDKPLREFPPATLTIRSEDPTNADIIAPIRADYPLQTAFSQLEVPDEILGHINDESTVFKLSACDLEVEFTSLKSLINSCANAVREAVNKDLSNTYIIDSVPICVLMHHIDAQQTTTMNQAVNPSRHDREQSMSMT
ncbi:hypothetical protein [Shewanella colwelliana]|uniref:hypothetical protein n=1 Tax=Shewanella colwelliana TaxID=23 RepID=UPI0022AF36F6|nr:hypothetical protein [Shewanella colwelliana]MCZ4337731.1 hypothetical protein [Shewanella colwelliana]